MGCGRLFQRAQEQGLFRRAVNITMAKARAGAVPGGGLIQKDGRLLGAESSAARPPTLTRSRIAGIEAAGLKEPG